MTRPMIVDSFAGGGGASTGIEMALGRSPDIAINHNPAALALHAANHPDTLHLSENVWQVDPLDHVKGRHVGLAWFSPDCKHFSKAKGGKPVERNIRDLAWVVVLWAQRARPDVIILENVEEFRDWGPLREVTRESPAGPVTVLMPDPEARGQTFQKWLRQLRREGYKVEWRELRACDYGAPTIRKRLFLVARCDGEKIVWPKPSHGRPDDPDVVAGRKRPWRTAAEIIDWSLPCPSIFDTGAEIMEKHGLRAVRPLADATMSRVARGVKRYVLDAKRPFIVNLTHGVRTEPVDRPFNTITGAHRGEKAVVAPSVIKFQTGSTGHAVDEPLHTVTANSFVKKPGGAAPVGIIAPSLVKNMTNNVPDSPEEPLSTILTGSQQMLVAPVLSAYYGHGAGSDDRSASLADPLKTVVTENRHAAIVPTLVGCGGRAGQSRPRGGDEPMATQTAKADVCVTAAFLAQHNNDGRREGGVNPGRPAGEPVSTITSSPQQGIVAAHLMTMRNAQKPFQGADEPAHTITAGGAGQTLVGAFVARQFGASTGHGLDEPSATATAAVNKSALVAPFLQKYYGTGAGQRMDDPTHSVTTKDRFGFVQAAVRPEAEQGHEESEIGWPPFTEAQADRARAVAAFLRAHGFWDEREFVTLTIGDDLFTIVDIGMRMLTPRELFSAQGFPPDYVIDLDFNGKPLPKDAQISCCGNSVSPPMAAALAGANCPHLAEFAEAAE